MSIDVINAEKLESLEKSNPLEKVLDSLIGVKIHYKGSAGVIEVLESHLLKGYEVTTYDVRIRVSNRKHPEVPAEELLLNVKAMFYLRDMGEKAIDFYNEEHGISDDSYDLIEK